MSITFNQMAEALATQRTLRQRLVNDLSHELNTPLSVIQLEMQALRDGLQTPAQAFEQVQGEIELLRNLVRDLSNLETTDNGHFPLQCEPVDLLALAQRAIKRWQAKAESKGVTLTLAAPVDLLPITEADPARLTQVLGNLLDNALRHTETGGTITVACQVATLAALALPPTYRPVTALTGPGLVMTVSDTGCGIPAADLPHLFERFYRVDSSRNRRSGGRGLGLAIVRQIITAHGGHLWVRSSEGQGSCFGFWLPINEIE
jgi:two-component system OmpR family sensor kinase